MRSQKWASKKDVVLFALQASYFMLLSDLDQFRGYVGQHLDAVVGDQHIVLDPDTAPTREIGAWLDGEDHACGDLFVLRVNIGPPSRNPRILVHLDAETVAGAMAERLAQTARRQRVARRRVDVEP